MAGVVGCETRKSNACALSVEEAVHLDIRETLASGVFWLGRQGDEEGVLPIHTKCLPLPLPLPPNDPVLQQQSSPFRQPLRTVRRLRLAISDEGMSRDDRSIPVHDIFAVQSEDLADPESCVERKGEDGTIPDSGSLIAYIPHIVEDEVDIVIGGYLIDGQPAWVLQSGLISHESVLPSHHVLQFKILERWVERCLKHLQQKFNRRTFSISAAEGHHDDIPACIAGASFMALTKNMSYKGLPKIQTARINW